MVIHSMRQFVILYYQHNNFSPSHISPKFLAPHDMTHRILFCRCLHSFFLIFRYTWCESFFIFRRKKMWYFFKILFCFVLICFVSFCFALFCFVLIWIHFALFCFVLFCFVLFCFVLFCFVLFCFVLFWFVLFCFVLFCFVLFCFVLFCFVCLLFSSLLFSLVFSLLLVFFLIASILSIDLVYVLTFYFCPTTFLQSVVFCHNDKIFRNFPFNLNTKEYHIRFINQWQLWVMNRRVCKKWRVPESWD